MSAAERDKVWTVLETLTWTAEFFGRQGALSPRLDAELLLAETLGLKRIQLYVQYDRPLTEDERARYRELVKRRGRGEPVQYILGRQEFWSQSFEVGPGILVPRPDTEVLVEEALAEAKRIAEATGRAALRIADVGTGSGAIAAAVASELPEARVWAGDIAREPLEVAPRNLAAAGVGDRVAVVHADGLGPLWEAAGREPFDLVLSNPPYIRAGEYAGLMREVRDFEPRGALVAGADGLDVIRPLVAEAAREGGLAPGGALAVEIGDRPQAEEVAELMRGAGFEAVRVRDDYAGMARVVVGRRPA